MALAGSFRSTATASNMRAKEFKDTSDVKKTRKILFRTHCENFLSAFSQALPWGSLLGASPDMEMIYLECSFSGSVR
jgi:hypothetical protein